eukprot:scaffold1102_cov256-Pinguiococcus_pyrenoidosus.AAC.30
MGAECSQRSLKYSADSPPGCPNCAWRLYVPESAGTRDARYSPEPTYEMLATCSVAPDRRASKMGPFFPATDAVTAPFAPPEDGQKSTSTTALAFAP